MKRQCEKPKVVTWLKVTDYMHGWLQEEFGGCMTIRERRVLSVQHLAGAKEVLRMETMDDVMEPKRVEKSMSATRMNCVFAGLILDPRTTEMLYGVTEEDVKLFVPIECPKMCVNKQGVLRPWTLDVCMSKRQATKMQNIIREAFWRAVEVYDKKYAQRIGNAHYYAMEMIEDFCEHTHTPGMYVEAMRREWQRRQKRLTG